MSISSAKIDVEEVTIFAQSNGDIVIADSSFNQVRISAKDFNTFIKERADIICQEKQQISDCQNN